MTCSAVRVGVADRGQVRLGVDDQVLGEEALHRHAVDGVGQDMGQAQVVVILRHALTLARPGPTSPHSGGSR